MCASWGAPAITARSGASATSAAGRCGAVALSLRVVVLTLLTAWGSWAGAEGFAVPTFPGREGVPAVVAERFVAELRSALAADGVRVTAAPLVTAGIAGSLEPAFGLLVAQLEGTRYAALGEILSREVEAGPYAVDVMAVDALAGRSSDLVSIAFGPLTIDAAAAEVAALLLAFTTPSATLPLGDAALFVSTEPNGAEVRVEGVAVGRSGSLDLLGLAPGRYEVEIRLPGYLPEVRLLDLRSLETRFLHVVLTEITGGSLQVVSRPTADLYLDGLRMGSTPATLTARAGEHEVELRRPGFVSRSYTVPVRSFRVTRLEADLEPVGEPLLIWPLEGIVRVLIDARMQSGGYAVAVPGLRVIEVLRDGEVRRWVTEVPEAGVFELDLSNGELVPFGD